MILCSVRRILLPASGWGNRGELPLIRDILHVFLHRIKASVFNPLSLYVF